MYMYTNVATKAGYLYSHIHMYIDTYVHIQNIIILYLSTSYCNLVHVSRDVKIHSI